MFLEILEEEYKQLDTIEEDIVDFLLGEGEEVSVMSLAEAFDLTEEEATNLYEQVVKAVDSTGTVTKRLSRDVRARRASLTTGISKSKLKLRARKAARTKKQNPMIGVRALKKRRKALRRRKQLGLN